jgi:hypothetical protein
MAKFKTFDFMHSKVLRMFLEEDIHVQNLILLFKTTTMIYNLSPRMTEMYPRRDK